MLQEELPERGGATGPGLLANEGSRAARASRHAGGVSAVPAAGYVPTYRSCPVATRPILRMGREFLLKEFTWIPDNVRLRTKRLEQSGESRLIRLRTWISLTGAWPLLRFSLSAPVSSQHLEAQRSCSCGIAPLRQPGNRNTPKGCSEWPHATGN